MPATYKYIRFVADRYYLGMYFLGANVVNEYGLTKLLESGGQARLGLCQAGIRYLGSDR